MPVSYFSAKFLFIFLPLFLIGYQIIPQKYRKYYLVIINFIFYWLLSGKLVIYLILSSLSIHYFGLWLKNVKTECKNKILENNENKKEIKNMYKKKEKYILLFAILIHIGTLVVLKYTSFFGINFNSLLKLLNINYELKIYKFMLPIGISFFALRCISYLIDIYRDKVEVDTNIVRLINYISFFPQIIEGPISRYKDTANELYECKNIDSKNLNIGFQRILFGLVKKIVVADRLNFFIETIFNNYNGLDGFLILIGAIFYTIQLYMEFSGTMDMVIGIGNILGVNVPENFRQPFFSKTISEFWSRWHITLGTFFKDYVYYPLTMSKPLKNLTLKTRKKIGMFFSTIITSSIALFVVWLLNGVWHGAAWQYIIFGLYHFILIFIGNLFTPLIKKINLKLKINNKNIIYKTIQIIRTIILVIFGELIFRSNSLYDANMMIYKIFTNFTFNSLINGQILTLGMDYKDFIIVFITLIFVLIISILKEKNISIREKIYSKPIYIRWVIYYTLIIYVLIFGAYGAGYLPVDPIYGRF